MPEPSDFEKKRAELERRRANTRSARLVANVALLPAEGQERVALLVEAFLVADDDEAARLQAALEARPSDVEGIVAMATEVLARHSPEELRAIVDGASDEELLRGMWRECADDLRRWAMAFSDHTMRTVDSATCEALERLAATLDEKAIEPDA